jgi:hypothetical protein
VIAEQEKIDDIQILLAKLIGEKCWYVHLGKGAGASFHLALGRKEKRTLPLQNPTVDETYRDYRGAYSLLVWCSWRLENSIRAIVSSDDEEEIMQQKLQMILDKKIIGIMLSPPVWDMTIRFETGLQLRMFCDRISDETDGLGNWQVRIGDALAGVGPGQKIEVEAVAPTV